MPKKIYTIEIEEPMDDEEIREILVISNVGFSFKARILPTIGNDMDGTSYEIDLSGYIRNMADLEKIWDVQFYIVNFMEYISHFANITMDFSRNQLSDEYLTNLLRALSDDRLRLLRNKLVKINLEQNRISKTGFLVLFKFIMNCPNFKELEASTNFLNQSGYFDLKESGEIPACIKDTFFYSIY